MGFLSELKKNDPKGLFSSNDTYINYPTGILPLDYANGFWQEVKTEDGETYHEPIIGIMGGTFISIIGATGTGKAVPLSEIIPTSIGPRRFGDLKVGDLVFNRYGNPVKIIGVYPQGEKDVYKVTFSDGRTARCCDEHLWSVYTSKGNLKTIPLKDMLDDYEMILPRKVGTDETRTFHKYKIPMTPALKFNIPKKDTELPIDPWVLGVFIGNGSLTEKYLSISCGDPHIPNKIAELYNYECIKNAGNNYRYNFKENESLVQTFDFFDGIDFLVGSKSYDKKIPYAYKYASIENRKKLLAGLMDTDGHISKKGKVRYTTVSETLKDDVVELCRSLGYRAYVTKDIHPDKYTTGVCYNIFISCPNKEKINLFTYGKKLDRAIKVYDNSIKTNHNILRIINIEKVGREEQMCIKVDDPDELFVTGEYVLTHNTTLADQIAFNIIKNFEDGLLYHIDAERTALRQRMIRVMGTDMEDERVHIKKENTSIEDVLEMIDKICSLKEAGGDIYKYTPPIHAYNGKTFKVYIPTVLVIDSIVSFNSKEYSTEDLGTNMDGARSAKALTRFVNNCLDRMQKYNITIIMISHIRAKVEANPYATAPPGLLLLKPGESVPGGINFQYMCQNFFRISMLKSNAYTKEEVGFDGFKASIQIAKTKTNFIGSTIDVAFNKDIGFDPVFSLYEFASSIGLIQGRNPYLYIQGLDTMKFSRKDFRRKFVEEKEFRDNMMAILKPHLENLLGTKEVTDEERIRFGDLTEEDVDIIAAADATDVLIEAKPKKIKKK